MITSANLNAHVDDAIIKPTFITAKAARIPGVLTDQILLESSGALYRMGLQTLYDLLVLPGSVIQTVAATPYTANANLGIIPQDDTIPQIGEGTQILSLNITPRSVSSQIRLTFNGFGGIDAAGTLIAAVFRGTGPNALKATTVTFASAGRSEMNIDWMDGPASTSPQNYTLRTGVSSGTGRMNGNAANRYFGGSASCTLVAQEIKG